MLTPEIRTVFELQKTLSSSVFFKIKLSPPDKVIDLMFLLVGSIRLTVTGVLDVLTERTALVRPRSIAFSAVVGDSISENTILITRHHPQTQPLAQLHQSLL